MKILFKSKKVQSLILDARKLSAKIGLQMAKKLKLRLDQLDCMENIGVLLNSGIDNPHYLEGDFYGRVAWSITDKNRLIIDLDLKNDEKYSEETKQIKELYIEGVCDYHDGKNEWIIH